MNPDETVMHHPKRKTLYDSIMKTPGISFRELLDVVGCSEGTLHYHLGYLQKKDIIRKEMRRGNRCYYCHDQKADEDFIPTSSMDFNRLQKQILVVVEEEPGINQKELCLKTRTNRFILSYHLNRLIQLGHISKEREGRKIIYYRMDEEEMKRKLLLKLVDELLDGKLDEDTYKKLKRKINGE